MCSKIHLGCMLSKVDLICLCNASKCPALKVHSNKCFSPKLNYTRDCEQTLDLNFRLVPCSCTNYKLPSTCNWKSNHFCFTPINPAWLYIEWPTVQIGMFFLPALNFDNVTLIIIWPLLGIEFYTIISSLL